MCHEGDSHREKQIMVMGPIAVPHGWFCCSFVSPRGAALARRRGRPCAPPGSTPAAAPAAARMLPPRCMPQLPLQLQRRSPSPVWVRFRPGASYLMHACLFIKVLGCQTRPLTLLYKSTYSALYSSTVNLSTY